jgi:2-dehydro-3-deoxy-D-arabinonate dehydratase
MQYYKLDTADTGLIVETDGTVYDLGTADTSVNTFRELAKAAAVSGTSIDRIGTRLTRSAETLSPAVLEGSLDRPIAPDEVWAAGVTYEISEAAL